MWLEEFINRFRIRKEEFFIAKRLIYRAQSKYKILLSSIGNKRLTISRADELLEILDRLQGTKIYYFIKDDVKRFRARIIYIREHPKENKLAYILATAYIISPGTFELTFAYLFLKYSWKYIFSFKNGKKF